MYMEKEGERMKKKILSAILCVAMACSLLIGCSSSDDGGSDESSGGSDGKTKITVVRPGDQDKVAAFLEPAVEQFMEDNPDIEVEIKYESWAGWIQTYPTYFEADTQPDVIF